MLRQLARPGTAASRVWFQVGHRFLQPSSPSARLQRALPVPHTPAAACARTLMLGPPLQSQQQNEDHGASSNGPVVFSRLAPYATRASVDQIRMLHFQPYLRNKDRLERGSHIFIELDAKDSQAEQQLKKLVKKKLEEKKHPAHRLIIDKRSIETEKPPEPQPPLLKRVFTAKFWTGLVDSAKKEFSHYKHGFQLLYLDIKISARLLKKVLLEGGLTRRERNQFIRTAGDIFRLVPFSAFIIVPGMELLLPFAIKFFPNMLPSQFQERKTKLDQQKAELRIKLDMARFLQETIEEMAYEKGKEKDSKSSLAEEFGKFLMENRKMGYVSTDAILKFAPLFTDSMTLDMLHRSQVRALSKLLGVNTVGPTPLLRYQLRTRLATLHEDDLMISKEGVDSLSTHELQTACRERGMRAYGISKQGLRQRLQHWLDLHITHGVPPTLLLMTRVLFLPEDVPEVERIRIVMESLPDSLKSQVKAEILDAEGSGVDSHLRLSIINAEEEMIREEQVEQSKLEPAAEVPQLEEPNEAQVAAPAHEDTSAAPTSAPVPAPAPASEAEGDAAPQKGADDAATPAPATPDSTEPEDVLVDTAPTVDAGADKDEEALSDPAETVAAVDKKERDKEMTKRMATELLKLDSIVDLAVVLATLSGQKVLTKQVDSLKDEVNTYLEAREEAKQEGVDDPQGVGVVSKASERLQKRVNKLVMKLEQSAPEVDGDVFAQLDLDKDGVISTDEILTAMRAMKQPPSEEQMQLWMRALDPDDDGRFNLNHLQHALKVVLDEGEDVTAASLSVIVQLVEKVDEYEGKAEASGDKTQ